LPNCGCLQKTGRTVSHQVLLQSLPRSSRKGGERISGLLYFFPPKSFHLKNHFHKYMKIRLKYVEITLFIGFSGFPCS
jgi:hypothetical protein